MDQSPLLLSPSLGSHGQHRADTKHPRARFESIPYPPSPRSWRSERHSPLRTILLVSLGICTGLTFSLHPRIHKSNTIVQRLSRTNASAATVAWTPAIRSTCPPTSFDAGHWVRKASSQTSLDSIEDLYAAINVTTCKARFQPGWNLGINGLTPPYTSRAEPVSYQWQPHASCHLRDISMHDKLQALVLDPLLLLGDSRTRQHFFQLSCELADHVIWQGEAPEADDNFDVRAWRFAPQHLMLDPTSPLVTALTLPPDFDFQRPILSFLMSYVPLSREEVKLLPGIDLVHVQQQAYTPYPALEQTMNRSLEFFANGGYTSMLYSTGAHFAGSLPLLEGAATPDVLFAERASLRVFFDHLASMMRPHQRVLVQAAGAGHSDCDQASGPLREIEVPAPWQNFQYLPDLNDILREETVFTDDPRFTFIGTERVSRLRPDAHLPGDCLHYAVGTGVMETWSSTTPTPVTHAVVLPVFIMSRHRASTSGHRLEVGTPEVYVESPPRGRDSISNTEHNASIRAESARASPLKAQHSTALSDPPWKAPSVSHSSLSTRIFYAIGTGILCYVLYRSRATDGLLASTALPPISACQPEAFENGQWQRKPKYAKTLDDLDAYFAAFDVKRCVAGFERAWNLGIWGSGPWDHRVDPLSYQWKPHHSCRLRQPSIRAQLQSLLDNPLFIVGDSQSRQHFFSLSCQLGEHLEWRGLSELSDESLDWQLGSQHLILNRSSSLYNKLVFPSGYLHGSPLVTFMQALLPLSRKEIRELRDVDTHIVPAKPDVDDLYELVSQRTIDVFLQPRPRYGIMLFSTGKHFGGWADDDFSNSEDPASLFEQATLDEVAPVMGAAVKLYFDTLSRKMRSDQRVLVRAAAPGQSRCETMEGPLTTTPQPGQFAHFDWMMDLNDILRNETLATEDERFTWLGLERIGRLRPDAHLPNDCYHFAVGTGVIETWTRYLWHHIVPSSTFKLGFHRS